MNTLHMLVGLQGAGKTTYAKSLAEEFSAEIVSSDKIRDLYPDWEESKIFPEVYRIASEYLKKGIDVVLDATSITPKVRSKHIETIKAFGVNFFTAAYFINVPYEVCYERVLKRNEKNIERYLPVDVIVSYASRLIPPTLEEGFKYIRVIDEIEDVLLKDLVVNPLQGYALYLKTKNTIIEKYQGKKKTEGNDLIDKYTNFRLASVTKQFIARAIVALVNDGIINYYTFLTDIYPDLPKCFRDVKIINLLNHTSGLPDYENMPHTDEQIHDEDVLEFLMKVNELDFKCGSLYSYSNTAYVLLGLIIEKMAKMPLDEFIKTRIFEKADMKNSFVNYQGITLVTNRAYGSAIVGSKLVPSDQYWCSATIGDGGLYSSVDDLIKWIEFLKIDEESKVMFKPNHLPDGSNTQYGLGIRIVEREEYKIIYHCGSTIGTNTIIGYLPDKNVEFIFLTNLDGIDCSKFLENLEIYLGLK